MPAPGAKHWRVRVSCYYTDGLLQAARLGECSCHPLSQSHMLRPQLSWKSPLPHLPPSAHHQILSSSPERSSDSPLPQHLPCHQPCLGHLLPEAGWCLSPETVSCRRSGLQPAILHRGAGTLSKNMHLTNFILGLKPSRSFLSPKNKDQAL